MNEWIDRWTSSEQRIEEWRYKQASKQLIEKEKEQRLSDDIFVQAVITPIFTQHTQTLSVMPGLSLVQ